MRKRHFARVALAIGVAMVAIAILPAHSGARAPSVGAADSLGVAATGNYGYLPSTFEQVPTNTTISVTFTDESNLPHTFTIIGKQGWVIPTTYSSSQIDSLGYGNAPPALFNLNVTGSGDVATGTFGAPGPGWYEFVCTVSGHFQNGMYGFIAFGENLPSNLTVPNNNRVGVGGGFFSWVGAATAVAVALILIAVFFVWRRRAVAARIAATRAKKP